jgi:hypothetical protein
VIVSREREQIPPQKRCVWCGKRTPDELRRLALQFRNQVINVNVCDAEHERAVAAFYRYVGRMFPILPIGLVAGFGLLVASNFVRGSSYWFIAGLVTIGITIIVCPLPTPQTVELLGLKRSVSLVRIVGTVAFIVAPLGFVAARLLR